MDPFFIAVAICAFMNIIGVFLALNKQVGRSRDYGIQTNGLVFLMNAVFLFYVSGWIAIPTLIGIVVVALVIQYFFLGGKEKAAQDKNKDEE